MTAADRLATLIRFRTVSAPDERDESQFEGFRQELARLYPRLHECLDRTVFEGGSMLMRWSGRSSERPVVLMAHYDVVPAADEGWTYQPFAGVKRDGVIHGRGSLDDKGSVVAICEAVETLLSEGFVPQQDVYVSFGADEEVFGSGAVYAVDHLRAAGVRPWMVLDEGGAVVDDAFGPIHGRFALIGIVEKGTVDVELVAEGDGGHASTPAKNSPTTRLARAIVALEENPAPARLSPPVIAMFEALSASVPKPLGLLLSEIDRVNRPAAWLLSKLGPELNAAVRTTMAVTRLSGSPANNVLASRATANVNVRLAVGDTVEDLRERLTNLLVRFDVQLGSVRGEDPPSVSRIDHEPWQLLLTAIAQWQPGVRAVPYVQNGGTDSRHFIRISDAVYRFAPLDMNSEQRQSVHAANEWVSEESLDRAVDFIRTLISAHA